MKLSVRLVPTQWHYLKISEEDTTETPMYVNRGGRLTILQEDQGQLLTLAGVPDGKLRAAGH